MLQGIPLQSQIPCGVIPVIKGSPGSPPLHFIHLLFTAGLLEALLSHPTMPVMTANSDDNWIVTSVLQGIVSSLPNRYSSPNCSHRFLSVFHLAQTLPEKIPDVLFRVRNLSTGTKLSIFNVTGATGFVRPTPLSALDLSSGLAWRTLTDIMRLFNASPALL